MYLVLTNTHHSLTSTLHLHQTSLHVFSFTSLISNSFQSCLNHRKFGIPTSMALAGYLNVRDHTGIITNEQNWRIGSVSKHLHLQSLRFEDQQIPNTEPGVLIVAPIQCLHQEDWMVELAVHLELGERGQSNQIRQAQSEAATKGLILRIKDAAAVGAQAQGGIGVRLGLHHGAQFYRPQGILQIKARHLLQAKLHRTSILVRAHHRPAGAESLTTASALLRRDRTVDRTSQKQEEDLQLKGGNQCSCKYTSTCLIPPGNADQSMSKRTSGTSLHH